MQFGIHTSNTLLMVKRAREIAVQTLDVGTNCQQLACRGINLARVLSIRDLPLNLSARPPKLITTLAQLLTLTYVYFKRVSVRHKVGNLSLKASQSVNSANQWRKGSVPLELQLDALQFDPVLVKRGRDLKKPTVRLLDPAPLVRGLSQACA